MRKAFGSIVFAALLAGCAEECPSPPTPMGDTVAVLAGNGPFGPGTAQAETAARYYCSSRGKRYELVSRERPQELRAPFLNEYSLLTFHCIDEGVPR